MTEEIKPTLHITPLGFATAFFDGGLMALYLIGGFGILLNAPLAQTNGLTLGYLAIGVFLIMHAIFGPFTRMAKPIENYDTVNKEV
jgi:hypothetical protein